MNRSLKEYSGNRDYGVCSLRSDLAGLDRALYWDTGPLFARIPAILAKDKHRDTRRPSYKNLNSVQLHRATEHERTK